MTFLRPSLFALATCLALAMAVRAEDQPPSLVPGQALFPEDPEEAEDAPALDVQEGESTPGFVLEPAPSGVVQSPTYTQNEKPIYPVPLRRSGHSGLVNARILVSKEGLPARIDVLDSAHPLLEQTAVRALRKWRFTPGTVNGQPADMAVIVPFKFRLTEGPQTEPYQITRASSKQKHKSPVVRLAVGAAYPYELLRDGRGGSANLVALIDSKGRVHEVEVKSATYPAFGHAAKAMLEAWTFKPATIDGSPVASSLTYKKEFSRNFTDMPIDPDSYPLLKKKESSRPRAFVLDELDAAPRIAYQPMPVVSGKLRAEGAKDKVVVEFYVNASGTVLLPRAIEYSNEALAWAAVTAVNRWQFDPPLKEGKPVLAKLRVPFAFR